MYCVFIYTLLCNLICFLKFIKKLSSFFIKNFFIDLIEHYILRNKSDMDIDKISVFKIIFLFQHYRDFYVIYANKNGYISTFG